MSKTETKDEKFSQDNLPEGTPEDPNANMNEDLSQDNDFLDFVGQVEPVAEPDNKPSDEEDKESSETSESEASQEEAVQDTEESETPSTEDTPDETEVSDKDATIEAQRQQLLEMARALGEKAETKESPEVAKQIELEITEFITDDEGFQNALSDPKALNDLLNKAVAKAVNEAHSKTMKVLPEATAAQIKNAARSQARVSQFFNENPELQSHMDYVSYMMGSILKEGGDKTSEQQFKDLATRCYQGLGLEKGKVKRTRQKAEAPGFAKTGGARVSKPKVNSMQTDINDLMGY